MAEIPVTPGSESATPPGSAAPNGAEHSADQPTPPAAAIDAAPVPVAPAALAVSEPRCRSRRRRHLSGRHRPEPPASTDAASGAHRGGHGEMKRPGERPSAKQRRDRCIRRPDPAAELPRPGRAGRTRAARRASTGTRRRRPGGERRGGIALPHRMAGKPRGHLGRR